MTTNTKNDATLYENTGSLVIAAGGTGVEMELNINGREYMLGREDILVLPPNMNLRYAGKAESCPGTDGVWRMVFPIPIEVVMELPSPFDTDLVSHARESPVVHIGKDDLGALEEVFRLLVKTRSEEESPYRNEIAKSLLFAMLYRLGNVYSRAGLFGAPHGAGRNESLPDKFFALLSAHYKTERTVKFYAARMSITPKYLSRAMRKITGKSAREWMDEAVILEIKNLLMTSDLTVLQISEALNFCTPSAMIQYFRLHTGATPAHYRKAGMW